LDKVASILPHEAALSFFIFQEVLHVKEIYRTFEPIKILVIDLKKFIYYEEKSSCRN
jgi:hypothetical protein